MGAGLSVPLRHGIANTLGSAGDDRHLALHPELLHDIGRGVGDRPGEALPDHLAICFVHRHCDGSALVIGERKREGRISE